MLSSKIFLILFVLLAFVSFSQADQDIPITVNGPTDPQIAHIVVTADRIDVDAGRLATTKTKNQQVKDFANTMVREHKSVSKKASALAKKIKLAPEDNDISKSLAKVADSNISNLKKLKGANFDKAYVDQEVVYHQQVLDTIDKALIPSAQNKELKSLLEETRPLIAAHLEHAKMVQTALNK